MKDDPLSLYDRLGFDTLPIPRGAKAARLRDWQTRPSYRLWRNAPANSNIGIRGGGAAHVAILDCDDKNQPGTYANVTNWLRGMGLNEGDYPVVKSASGIGRHVYVSFAGGLTGDYRNLSPDLGAGEFRYGPGAYVVAPPSMVEGGIYVLINGQFERLPSLTLADVLPILSAKENKEERAKRPLPRLAEAILRGNRPAHYRSDSDAEEAALLSLANVGFELADVEALYRKYPGTGKFEEIRKEKGAKEADRWLAMSYKNAVLQSKHESQARQKAQAALDWAMSSNWPGRTGVYDQGAYMAAARIAHRAGKLELALACRDVAEEAGINKNTAAAALRRLVSSRLLDIPKDGEGKEIRAVGECATKYRLNTEACKLSTLPKYPTVRECTKFAPDTFRKGRGKAGLPPSARPIYQALEQDPANVKELAERTGRDKRTIRAVLKLLAGLKDRKTGEVLAMVEQDGEKWKALPVDLQLVAEVMGTAGATHRQKLTHEKERRAHARALREGKNGT